MPCDAGPKLWKYRECWTKEWGLRFVTNSLSKMSRSHRDTMSFLPVLSSLCLFKIQLNLYIHVGFEHGWHVCLLFEQQITMFSIFKLSKAGFKCWDAPGTVTGEVEEINSLYLYTFKTLNRIWIHHSFFNCLCIDFTLPEVSYPYVWIHIYIYTHWFMHYTHTDLFWNDVPQNHSFEPKQDGYKHPSLACQIKEGNCICNTM